MRVALGILVVLVCAGAGAARAQQVAPALEVDLGLDRHVVEGEDNGGVHVRGAAGVQVGPVAALAVVERMMLTSADADLDSRELDATGYGFAIRVDAWRRRDRFAHITAGATWYDLEGRDEVTRTCGEFGTCVAGWYFETPAYSHTGVHLAGAIGVRTRGRIWSGVGVRFGVTHFSLDRPGTGPDADGALVWLALTALVGGR